MSESQVRRDCSEIQWPIPGPFDPEQGQTGYVFPTWRDAARCSASNGCPNAERLARALEDLMRAMDEGEMVFPAASWYAAKHTLREYRERHPREAP